ncbi:MAG TPA: ATP-binding protein [Labilithrix sp.]
MLECLEPERIARVIAEAASRALACTAMVEITVDGGSVVARAPEERPSHASASATAIFAVGGELHVHRATPFDASERELIEELGRRGAAAVQAARATRDLREAARRAEEASRLKDEFLAIVSHELRTPLSSILGWTQVLTKDPSLAQKGLAIIERNARAQQRLVEDMLDLGRIITGKLRVDTEPVDLATLARDAVESAKPGAATRGVDLEVAAAATVRLAGDAARLRQVVVNLVSNAIKFTPEGGRVRVEVAREGDRVLLRVSDSGRGIEPEFLPHVFDRWAQAEGAPRRSRADGLGLGLAIARHLVDMHAGTIDVASDGLGKGATFTVSIPVKPFSAPVRKARSMPPMPTQPLAGMRALVVEDEQDSRALIELLLATEGATVCAVESADAALEAVAGFRPHVVVSDIGMPGRDGYWLAGELARCAPGTPAIALTAFSTNDDVARALAAGFVRHVAKPVEPEQLVAALLDLRSGRTPSAA